MSLEITVRLDEPSNLEALLEGVPAVQTQLHENEDGTYRLCGIVHVPTARQMGVIDRVTYERKELREALKLAYSCLLEVRRDFDAPINNVIAEVRAALEGAK